MMNIERIFGLKVMTSRMAPPGEIWIITPQEGPAIEAVLDAIAANGQMHAVIRDVKP